MSQKPCISLGKYRLLGTFRHRETPGPDQCPALSGFPPGVPIPRQEGFPSLALGTYGPTELGLLRSHQLPGAMAAQDILTYIPDTWGPVATRLPSPRMVSCVTTCCMFHHNHITSVSPRRYLLLFRPLVTVLILDFIGRRLLSLRRI